MRFRVILALGLILAAAFFLGGQGAQQHLYLLSAVNSPNGEPNVPSTLWKVDNNRLAKVAELAADSAGSDFVAVNHDKRVLIIGTPGGDPARLVLVNMDSPTSPRHIPVTVPSWSLRNGWFLSNPNGLLFSVRIPKLHGVELTSGKALELPWEAYAGIRRDGWWTPGDGFNGNFHVNVKDDKLIARVGVVATFDLGVAPPKTLAAEPKDFSLIINTDTMLVLDRLSVRGHGIDGSPGNLQLEIYDKVARTWRTEHWKGGGSSVRAFKEWLAVNQGDIRRDISVADVQPRAGERQSAGADRRQRVINPQARPSEQIRVDSLFKESAAVFDGIIHLLNVRTGTRYRLDTNQGDSEVLLIEGTTVYYRVNDVLFRARLGRTNLESPVEILRDDNLQLSHWAFFAP